MQHIGFYLNASEYSIPILSVREIIKTPAITKIPQSPSYIEGITNIRGNVIPIVNLKNLINANGDREKSDTVIVISIGKITFGILVDGIAGAINVDEASIEPSEHILKEHVEQVEGVAKLSDRLVILLDTKKLFPLEDMSLFEGFVDIVQESDIGTVELMKTVQTMAGEVTIRELNDAKEFFLQKGIDASDPRFSILEDVINFMNALVSQDCDKADSAVQNILKKGKSDLFMEVGRITRKLHDSLRIFKESIDPKFREFATVEMPNAIDSLQSVIDKTEEAANRTLGIVEKYILKMDDLCSHISDIKTPEASVNYLRNFKNDLENDLTEILTTQSFQDITGQTLKKVIKLVGDIEGELVRLIANFGVKVDQAAKTKAEAAEKVSQHDIDDLLKDFGF